MEDLSIPKSSPEKEESAAISSSLDFPVVGIGASAGGLQALLRFFENMPSENGMAFVVILHLSPQHESNADVILQRATRMPVIQVFKPIQIEKNHVYVISPNQQLSMEDGHLLVAEEDRPRGQHVAVDLFFRTLADAHKERAVGIVMSGTGADGAVGLSRLKEQGGVTIAQSPGDAEHDGMPLAAVATGIIDFILPVVEMPQKLVDICSNARIIQLPEMNDPEASIASLIGAPEVAEKALLDVLTMLRVRTGHDFRHYKRATVLRRIERRLQVRGVANLPAYRALLDTDEQEGPALLKDMLIGVTNFFRDREAFDALEREILPQIFQNKQGDEQVRAWVAACSTGEEAYSLTMLLCDQASLLPKPPGIQVFASDIDEHAIATARIGVYPLAIATDVPPSRLRQFFTKDDDCYRVKKGIRDRILFAAHNMLRDPPFSRLDMISCRNLLIYLNRDVQTQVLEMFHYALNPGGFLFLGSSESADAAGNFFTPVDKKSRIYQARTLARSTRYTPLGVPFGLQAASVVHDVARQPDKRKFSFSEVHQRVLAQYAPPSVIVNQESNIVHMSDRAGRFLYHIGGEPSRNLVSLALPELRMELRTAIFQAWQSRKSVEARRVQLKRDERRYYVNMTVRPFHDDDAATDFALVLFDEVEETMSEPPVDVGDHKDMVLTQLEQELQRTKEQLQETIEHSEISNEELRASNEELQAINEELRSATEELETSKEELQSVNEELITVNFELKMKVEETGKINDDLNNLIASTDIATVFLDGAMRIKRYTPRATAIFSIISTDIGRSLLDITHRLDYPQLADDAAATFDTLRPVEREVHSNDGHCYVARMLPYRTTEDRIDGAVLTFIEITNLRQVEEKLRVGEERMRLAAESTKDYAIITMDFEGCVTSWNKGAERMFGFTEEEILGRSGDVIFLPEDRDHGVPEDERRRAREDGRAEDERWHVRKNGARLFCSGVMTPVSVGEFEGYAKIARDQTERKLQEGQRAAELSDEQQRRGKAQVASAMKDEFLAIMSHELRHPLNLIHINAQLLARIPEIAKSTTGMRAAMIIRNAVINQAKIIDDLLDLSRVNTGKLTLSLSEFDLCAAVEAIVEVMRADPASADLKIAIDCMPGGILINADRVRIEQVVLNLLNNAIKFTPAGGAIDVRLRCEDDMARLDVIDNGQGIASELLPHLFNMSNQPGAMTMRSQGGLGIGLTLVRHIAELHGGRVEAASEGLGRGARFSVWFPIGMVQAGDAEQDQVAECTGVAGLSILLVDDVKEAVEALAMLLELDGAKVLTATSAAEALDVLDAHHVDLLVSDIAMPRMDGHALIKEVRNRPALAGIPAIALTGLGRPEDAERACASGFSAHIAKPVSLEVLVETAVSLCRKD